MYELLLFMLAAANSFGDIATRVTGAMSNSPCSSCTDSLDVLVYFRSRFSFFLVTVSCVSPMRSNLQNKSVLTSRIEGGRGIGSDYFDRVLLGCENPPADATPSYIAMLRIY